MVNSNKKETKVLPLKKKPKGSEDLSSNLPDDLSKRLKALQESIDNGSYKVAVTDLVSSLLSKSDELSSSTEDVEKPEITAKTKPISLKILKDEK